MHGVAGWWFWADACTSSDVKVKVLPNYLPGFVATIALIMINAVRRQGSYQLPIDAMGLFTCATRKHCDASCTERSCAQESGNDTGGDYKGSSVETWLNLAADTVLWCFYACERTQPMRIVC